MREIQGGFVALNEWNRSEEPKGGKAEVVVEEQEDPRSTCSSWTARLEPHTTVGMVQGQNKGQYGVQYVSSEA